MNQERKIPFGSSHWLDVTAPSRADLERIAKEYGLHPQMVTDCLDPGHLPKFQRTEGVSFLILRAFDEGSSPDSTTVQECTRKVALFWGEGFVVTVHSTQLLWMDSLFADWKKRGLNSISTALQELVEETIFTFERPIDDAGVAVDELEDTIFNDKSSPITSNDILESAYLAKKRATLFKRLLRLTRDLVPQISKLGEPGSPAIQSLKEEADRLYFYADDLVETANDLVELSISLTTNRTNEIVRLLTIVSIFLLPLNVVTGVYGMNFRSMPELEHPYGYGGALVLMVAIVTGTYLVLKKKGWIR